METFAEDGHLFSMHYDDLWGLRDLVRRLQEHKAKLFSEKAVLEQEKAQLHTSTLGLVSDIRQCHEYIVHLEEELQESETQVYDLTQQLLHEKPKTF